MQKVVLVFIQSKGGVGKSLTAIEMAAWLSRYFKVIAIDLDPKNKTLTTTKRHSANYAGTYGTSLGFELANGFGGDYEICIVDTPGAFIDIETANEGTKKIINTIMAKATLVLVPITASLTELGSVNDTMMSLRTQLATPVPFEKIVAIPNFIRNIGELQTVETIATSWRLEPLNAGGLPFYPNLKDLHGHGQTTSSSHVTNGALEYLKALESITQAIMRRAGCDIKTRREVLSNEPRPNAA